MWTIVFQVSRQIIVAEIHVALNIVNYVDVGILVVNDVQMCSIVIPVS